MAFNSKNLKKCIKELTGGNRAAFANMLGVVPNTVKGWELGDFEPKRDQFTKLLEVTGKTEQYFYPPIDYSENPEDIGIPAPDSDHVTAGRNDLERHRAVEKIELPDKAYRNVLNDLLRTRNNYRKLIKEMIKHRPKDGQEKRRLWILLDNLAGQEAED